MAKKEKMNKYILQICEPWNFKAPDGSNEFEIAILKELTQKKDKFNEPCFLTKVLRPFKWKRKEYNYIILSARWYGKTIKDFFKSTIEDIDVYVNRLINPKVLGKMTFDKQDIDYCAIGTLKRHK